MRVLSLALFALLVSLSAANAKTPHAVATTTNANSDIRLEQGGSAASSDEEDVTSGSDDDAVRSGSDDLAIGIDRDSFANGGAEDNGPEAPDGTNGALSRDGGFNLAPAR